jgi:formylglycine-generating enzyme required for sulfatase activity
VVLPVVVRRPTDDDPLIPTTPTIPVSTPAPEGMVLIAGGTFSMGSDGSSFPADRPAHEVRVDPYFMDKVEVTNAQFQQFVNATRYQTHAEKQGWSIVFDARVGQYEAVSGASWKSPEGPNSNIIGREQLPVVHVSWHDAAAYARWAGKRLPTEAEWEFAARGGYLHASFPWGRDMLVDGRYQANTWQGEFPKQDLARDGFRSLAPVASYNPNHFGLYDMSGNVWEWCGDWYEENLYSTRAGRVTENPMGPADGFLKAQRGGSYLSAESNAPAFTVFGRMASDPTSTFPHLGFRCVRDANAMARR